jgi:hypothetical protein
LSIGRLFGCKCQGDSSTFPLVLYPLSLFFCRTRCRLNSDALQLSFCPRSFTRFFLFTLNTIGF